MHRLYTAVVPGVYTTRIFREQIDVLEFGFFWGFNHNDLKIMDIRFIMFFSSHTLSHGNGILLVKSTILSYRCTPHDVERNWVNKGFFTLYSSFYNKDLLDETPCCSILGCSEQL